MRTLGWAWRWRCYVQWVCGVSVCVRLNIIQMDSCIGHHLFGAIQWFVVCVDSCCCSNIHHHHHHHRTQSHSRRHSFTHIHLFKIDWDIRFQWSRARLLSISYSLIHSLTHSNTYTTTTAANIKHHIHKRCVMCMCLLISDKPGARKPNDTILVLLQALRKVFHNRETRKHESVYVWVRKCDGQHF